MGVTINYYKKFISTEGDKKIFNVDFCFVSKGLCQEERMIDLVEGSIIII